MAGGCHYGLHPAPRPLPGERLLRHRLGELERVHCDAGRDHRHNSVLGPASDIFLAATLVWHGSDKQPTTRRPQLLCRCDRCDGRLPAALPGGTTARDDTRGANLGEDPDARALEPFEGALSAGRVAGDSAPTRTAASSTFPGWPTAPS